MVVLMRTDLNITKGNVAKEVSSATIDSFEAANSRPLPEGEYWKKVVNRWSWEGQKKIVLKAQSEDQMEQVYE